MQNEYIDLPINIQETPKQLLEKAPVYKVPEKADEAAHQILKTLQSLIKGPANEIYVFYQTAFPATNKAHFIDKQWPSTSSLEQSFDTQYKPGAQTIYKEFALRGSWNKIKNQRDNDKYCDIIDEAWEEYTSIFKLELTRINFPAEMIWDYFDSFLEIYLFHQHKKTYVTGSTKFKADIFSSEACKQMFKQMSAAIPANFNPSSTSRQIFAYYSLVALAVLAVNQGDYKQALSYISKISLKEISVFSKGLGSLLTLFFIAAFSYFMLEEFHRSVKVCEIIVTFFQKYRKFYDKSFSYFSQLQPIYEKLVILQCINYIFLQEKPKTAVLQIFKNTNVKTKEKEARDKISDCFFKMKQNDVTTFWRLFNFLSNDFNIPNLQKNITQNFKKLQSVNINTIIQNYKRIELQKISKMLGIPIEQIRRKFKSLGAVEKTQSAWDSTIINPLLRQKKKVNVLIEENIAIFDSQNVDSEEYSREWERYREEMSWLSEKAKAI